MKAKLELRNAHAVVMALKRVLVVVLLFCQLACGKGVGLLDSKELPDPLVDLNSSFSYPTHGSSLIGEHDIPARTLTFSHDGASVQCSHDAGSSWGACDSENSIVFTTADYNSDATLMVRISRGGARDYEFSYNPKSKHPGLVFIPCNTVVTSDMNFTDFALLIDADDSGKFVCINSGVSISNDGTENRLSVAAASITIIGTSDYNAKIVNDRAAVGVCVAGGYNPETTGLFANGKTVTLYNMNISQSGCRGAALEMDSSAGSGAYTILNTHVTASGENSDAVAFYSNSANTMSVNIAQSSFTSSGTQSGASYPAALYMHQDVSLGIIQSSSFFAQNGYGIEAYGGAAVNFNNNTVQSNSTSVEAIRLDSFFGVFNWSIAYNTILAGYRAAQFVHGGGNTGVINLEGNTFKRLALGSGGTFGMYLLGSGPMMVNSATNGNFFCDLNGATANWTSLLSVQGGSTNTGTFNPASQTNAGNTDGDINDCP